MKNLVLLLCCVLLLTSCGSDSELEYKDPNLVRRKDSYEEDYESGYNEGFNDGYGAGFEEIENIIDEAEHYAWDQGGWSPEEAMWVIEMYQTKVSYHSDGSLPTKEEYREAINSLVAYYEFFYNGFYEEYYDP